MMKVKKINEIIETDATEEQIDEILNEMPKLSFFFTDEKDVKPFIIDLAKFFVGRLKYPFKIENVENADQIFYEIQKEIEDFDAKEG